MQPHTGAEAVNRVYMAARSLTQSALAYADMTGCCILVTKATLPFLRVVLHLCPHSCRRPCQGERCAWRPVTRPPYATRQCAWCSSTGEVSRPVKLAHLQAAINQRVAEGKQAGRRTVHVVHAVSKVSGEDG